MVLQAGFRADRRPREFFGPRLWKPPMGDKAKFLGGGHSPLLCFEPWWYESWYGTMPAFASINVGDTTLCIFTKKWQHQESIRLSIARPTILALLGRRNVLPPPSFDRKIRHCFCDGQNR